MAGAESQLLEDFQNNQPADPEQVVAVRHLLPELTKTAKIFRTYPRDNDRSISAIDNLTEMFTTYLEAWSELELFVERDKLYFKTEIVHEDNSSRRSIPIKLDRAGVRRLILSPGLSREEIVDFFDVLTAELDDDSLQDDIVTLMWDKQFTHIRAFILDELTDDEEYDASKAGVSDPKDSDDKEYGGSEDDASSRKTADDGTDAGERELELERDELAPEARRLEDAHKAAQLAEACKEMKGKLPPLSEQDVHLLKNEAALQETMDVSNKLADILSEILRTSTEDESTVSIRRVIGQLVIMHMRSANFSDAVKMLRQMQELAGDPSLNHEVSQNLRQAVTTLFTDDHVGELRDILLANPGAVTDGLDVLARYFPKESIVKMLDLMTLDRDQDELQGLFLKVYKGHAHVLAKPLVSVNEPQATRIMELLEELSGEEDVPALGDMLPRLSGALRTRLVNLIASFTTDEARNILAVLVSDSDPQVRKAAVQALAGFEEGLNSETLRSQVVGTDFDRRSLEEKKSLMMTLAQTEQAAAVDLLMQIVEQKKWFESEKHKETRACAVLALGQTATDKAQQALERYAQGKDQAIRGAARLALNNLKTQTAAVG